jgi:hypothetical protein
MVPGFSPTAIFVHHDVDKIYRTLEEAAKLGRKPQQAIWKRFQAAKRMIQSDGQWGDVVKKDDIPEYFRQRYRVDNLYCVDLKNDVRCFYTIDERDVVFLDIVDHDEYDKWFPPKGSKKRRR